MSVTWFTAPGALAQLRLSIVWQIGIQGETQRSGRGAVHAHSRGQLLFRCAPLQGFDGSPRPFPGGADVRLYRLLRFGTPAHGAERATVPVAIVRVLVPVRVIG